jgi:uncharacterized protein (TIGR02145 family)
MKKILLSAAFIAASFTSIAQVGIGTTTPGGALDIVSTTSGLVMPRVANTSVVVNPNGGAIENGTMVYDLSINCINVYVNGAWTGCIQSAATPSPNSQVSDGAGGFYAFMRHNLGADTALDPHTPVVGLQGGYVQWGKPGPANWVGAANDGANGFAAAPTASAANNAAISGWSGALAANDSWNVAENNPIKVTANDPCPAGFRVPTTTEWTAVNTNNTASRTGTFGSSDTNYGTALHFGTLADPKLLTLPTAGRISTGGTLGNRGDKGYYWSSTETGDDANRMFFDGTGVNPTGSGSRATGFSVRCIAE